MDKSKPLEWEEFVVNSFKSSKYYKKIKELFTEEEMEDFTEGLRLGTFNGVTFRYNQMNMRCWDSKDYRHMIKDEVSQKHFGVYGGGKIGKNLVYKGNEIGEVNFMQAWGIADYVTYVPVENGCDRCGYTKFCHCYGFSTLGYRMTGCHGHHFGHEICIICGERSKSGKNFMCKECNESNETELRIKPEEEYRKDEKYKYTTEFRSILFKDRLYKCTFFKDNNMKCLECGKEVDPMCGLVACSTNCTKKMLEIKK
jgi:hypothetical protein